MKLSPETTGILKNFASINQGILFKQGDLIATVSPQKNILAQAKISEEIPKEFGIYDLNNFLSVISLFKEGSELDFDDYHVIIQGLGGRSKIKYRVTDSSMIVAAPDKRPNIPEFEIKFILSKDDFDWILKTANVLGSPHISVESTDGETISLVAFNASDDSASTNSLRIADADANGKTFSMVFKTENLKAIPDTYQIEISSKGISVWTAVEKEIIYWITTETISKFNA